MREVDGLTCETCGQLAAQRCNVTCDALPGPRHIAVLPRERGQDQSADIHIQSHHTFFIQCTYVYKNGSEEETVLRREEEIGTRKETDIFIMRYRPTVLISS